MENQYLSKARLHRLWTPEKASKKVGVALRTYQRWEKGTHLPTMETLQLLCEAFGETPETSEKLGYIVDIATGRIRLRLPEEDSPSTEEGSEQLTDDLAQAHEHMLESLRRSLKRLPGTALSKQEASQLDKLMSDVLSILAPSLDMTAVGVSLWLCDRVDKLKRIGFCQQITSQWYQAIMHAEIESWQSVVNEDYQITEAYRYTRRMAIENLLLLPAPFLTALQFSLRPDYVAQEFLTQCAPCIMACSYLLDGDGLATVEHMLPPYLRQLTKLAKSPSPLQKQAAYLSAQGCCLMGTVKSHRRKFYEDVRYCNQAVEFAQVTGNSALVAATFTRLGYAWFYFGQLEKYLEAYQEAERLLKEQPALFPARLQSRIYTGLSAAHARLGHKQDAEYYLGMANTISLLPDDDLFIPCLDYDLSFKILTESAVYREIGEQREKKRFSADASSWYKKAEVALAQQLPQSGGFPERILIELLNQQGSIAEKLGDKDHFIIYVKAGVIRAKAIGSKKREDEAKANVSAGKLRWPREKDVLELDQLFDEDGSV